MKPTLTALALGVSLLLASGGVGYAADFMKGREAWKRGDYATALREWRPLAEKGNASAQYNLGQIYRRGLGVIQDYKEAAKWYRKAAEQGYGTAWYNLGAMYNEGNGVDQDYKEAVKWWRKAAEQGDAWAQNNLGVKYASGQGVIQDNVYAHMWFNIAAANGNKVGAKSRDIIAKKMTPADISKAQELARRCVARKYKGC
jgi:TPR repeat protein